MLSPSNVCRFLGVIFLLLGVAYTFNPVGMFSSTGETLSVAAAITDIRAVYGGMEIGIGIFLLWQSYYGDSLLQALRLMLFVFIGLLFSRIVGIIQDGGDQMFNYVIIGVEIICLAISVIGYRKCAKT